MRSLVIAIDGPSGAGKGTVARAVASRLGYQHVDTGAMYRGIAWKAVHEGVDLADEEAVTRVAQRAQLDVSNGACTVDGRDVKQAIRTPEIDAAAAAVARLPRVRQVLIAQQREMGRRGAVVMEGRDIGTVVFPDADVKVYLDASPAERARRRAFDPGHAAGKGAAVVSEVASALAARDRSDSTRPTSPLAQAPDAVRIDTTGLSIEDVVSRVLALATQRSEE